MGNTVYIFLTGPPGSGKTTICRDVARRAGNKNISVGGILSPGDDRGGKYIEDLVSGEMRPLSRRRLPFPLPGVSRYRFFPAAFRFADTALEAARETDLLVVDELGSLEKKGAGYRRALPLLRQRRDEMNLVVVRKNLLHFYKNELNCTPLVIDLPADDGEDPVLEIMEKIAPSP